MCLGIPGEVVELVDDDLQLAKVNVGGVRRNVNIGLVNDEGGEVEVGDWVLIHVGFALAKIDEQEAESTLRALEDIGAAYVDELAELHASRIE